jgi:FkbM family methyltransferase
LNAVRESLRKARKFASVIVRPSYRRGLRLGVAAATEHHSVAFEHEFATVIDVGANRGQFGLFAARRFPGAELHCFEPLPEARETLASALGEHPRLRVHGVALGATNRTDTFNVAASDDSSSLLTATATQTASFPKTEVAERRSVEVARLDDIVPPQAVSRPCLLKVDVQGYELEVLRGAQAMLDVVDELLIECSFVELYEGQPLAAEIVALCADRGFPLAGVFSLVRDEGGRCLQGDFLFVRSPEGPSSATGGSEPAFRT